jgi:hypothetical protein
MLETYPGYPTFGFSHRHVRVKDNPIYDPDDCEREFLQYWNNLMSSTPSWVAWFNGHDRAGTGQPDTVHDGKPACSIVENNAPHPGYPSGTPVVSFFLNYQDNENPELPPGIETGVVEVITINWDQNTINVQIYEPTKDAFVPSGTAQYADHTWTDLELDRFLVLVDTDGDDVADIEDNCPELENPGQQDYDQDTVGDACDNCPWGPNPEQGAAPFGQSVIADDLHTFSWPLPVNLVYAKGNLADVSRYGTTQTGSVPLAAFHDDFSLPKSGSGHYYLFKPDCPNGSWQTDPGAEPARDVSLPE